jgi:hypothetical protein
MDNVDHPTDGSKGKPCVPLPPHPALPPTHLSPLRKSSVHRPRPGTATSHRRASVPRAGSPSYWVPYLFAPPSGCILKKKIVAKPGDHSPTHILSHEKIKGRNYMASSRNQIRAHGNRARKQSTLMDYLPTLVPNSLPVRPPSAPRTLLLPNSPHNMGWKKEPTFVIRPDSNKDTTYPFPHSPRAHHPRRTQQSHSQTDRHLRHLGYPIQASNTHEPQAPRVPHSRTHPLPHRAHMPKRDTHCYQ